MKKYKCGYCAAVVYATDFREYAWIKEISSLCERFVLGIPDSCVMERIPEVCGAYHAETVKEYWSNVKWIDEVVILDEEAFSYQKAWELFQFDACFYGSEYGLLFQADAAFMTAHGVDFLPVMPKEPCKDDKLDALGFALKNYQTSHKIVVFGSGDYFDYYMENYGASYPPAYVVDNSGEEQNTTREGVEIKKPSELYQENSEKTVVIICVRDYQPVLTQLQEAGKFEYRLLPARDAVAVLENFEVYRDVVRATRKTLDKIQEINYEMLKVLDGICRENGVEYFLNYGSLLGAIRHKGFIPWDNDVDTIMTRENYKKLERLEDAFDDRYYFLKPDCWGKKKYYDCVPRLGYKAAYIRLPKEEREYYNNHNNRIHLDFFLIDKTYDNFRGKLQRFELAVLYGMMNAYRHESFFFDYDKKMRIANAILMRVGRCLPLPWLRRRVEKVATRFNKDAKAPYYFISNDALCKLKVLFPKDIFDHTVDIQFGDVTAMAACGYDEMCRIIFGNYMQLPPVWMQVPHLGRRLITADLYVFQEPEKEKYE